MSGIYKAGEYRLEYYERLPYDQPSIRSIYPTRQYNDWLQPIEPHGNLKVLLKLRPGFGASVDADTLGSPPLMILLKTLIPKWWFTGHMHERFEAKVKRRGRIGGRGEAESEG